MIMLNERKKEYSVIDLNDINKRDDGEEYTVTRLGEENLHGMHCVRSKAVNEDGHTMEIWTTTEIPGYEDIAALYSKMQKMGSDYLWDELQQADAAGFMVKLEVQAEGGTSVMERSEEHTSELQSLMRISYAVFCLQKKIQ